MGMETMRECITIDKGYSNFDKYIDKQTGFLHLNGIVARDGIQTYLGVELGDKENPMKEYKVLRPTEEVLKKESLDTYINATVTDDHPQSFVTVDNVAMLHKGSAANYEIIKDGETNLIKVKLVITDKILIDKVMNGKVEISAGYSQNLIKEQGTWKGEAYDYKQTDIKINHIAIVDQARCGSACKLTADKNAKLKDEKPIQRKSMATVTIDGVTHEINDCVAKHLGSLKSSLDSYKEKMDEKEEEMEKLKKDMEELEAQKDMAEEEAKKAKTSDADIAKIVDAKVEMLTMAKAHGVDVKVTDSVSDMKKAVVAAKTTLNLDGKSEAYIDAAFDMLKIEQVKKSQDSAQDGFKSKGSGKSFADLANVEVR